MGTQQLYFTETKRFYKARLYMASVSGKRLNMITGGSVIKNSLDPQKDRFKYITHSKERNLAVRLKSNVIILSLQ